jgi:hypothetical protein
MRTNNIILASVAMGLLGGCLPAMDTPTQGSNGSNGSNTMPGATARDTFNSEVEPLLSKCSGCHVGPETGTTNMFLGQSNTPDSHYNGLINDTAVNGAFNPNNASLLTKGAHEGPAWQGNEKNAISAWLEQEATERGSMTNNPTPPPPPAPTQQSARDAEMQWATCMGVSQTEYNSTKAYMVAEMQSNQGRCYSCHEPGGAGGAYWGRANNYLTMLQKWQTEVFITGAFAAQAAPDGKSYKMITAQAKICAKGQEQNNGAGTHPAFDCNQTVGGVQPMQALEQFRIAVQAKQDANTCGQPAFAPNQ